MLSSYFLFQLEPGYALLRHFLFQPASHLIADFRQPFCHSDADAFAFADDISPLFILYPPAIFFLRFTSRHYRRSAAGRQRERRYLRRCHTPLTEFAARHISFSQLSFIAAACFLFYASADT